MAIRIEKLESDWVEYVPDVGDNRADDNPVTCEIHPMSVAEMRELHRRHAAKLSGKRSTEHAIALIEKVISENVRNVRNLYIQRPITTGEELAQYGLSSIIDDVFAAITDLSKLSDGLKKSSSELSDSSTASTDR